MNKDSFILYSEMYEAIKFLSDEKFGKLFKAIFEYTINGNIPEDEEILIAFMFIKNSIDKNNEKWENIKQKRSEAGSRHKGNQYTKRNETNGTSVPTVPKNGTNGTVNANVNVNVNDNVINNSSKDEYDNIKKESIKEKRNYGEFENVRLTDDEFKKLMEKFPNNYLEKIDRLSGYIASKGVRYKSHYATILNWARKDDIISNKPKTRKEKEEEFWAKIDKEIEDEKRRDKESN